MDVIGLVSGGKDSCFNMLECVRRGHRIVALANLMPAAEEVQELDSHMIQTVGHTAIANIAACCGVPLVRFPTSGAASRKSVHVRDDLEAPSGPDEVDDLYSLLTHAKTVAPTANGVAVGAILSNYQRTRVEHVCALLGLQPLAFLWERRQPRLLRDMLDCEMDVVLCKVASMGLKPSMLGKPLAQVQPLLARCARDFQVNICGEGGEYESLTLACPGLFLPGAHVVLDEIVVEHVSRDKISPVAHLNVVSSRALARDAEHCLPLPPVECHIAPASVMSKLPHADPARPTFEVPVEVSLSRCSEGLVHVSTQSRSGSVSDQVTSQLARVQAELGGACDDVVFVHLWLPDMASFGEANEVYCSFFDEHPPSRACVGVDPAQGVKMEAMAVVGSAGSARGLTGEGCRRSTLHVRSLSCWAPLCIGPYCQANRLNDVVWCAGQIGLQPDTMRLVEGWKNQLHLSLQSCARVLASQASSPRGVVACTVFVSEAACSHASDIRARVVEWLNAGSETCTDMDDPSRVALAAATRRASSTSGETLSECDWEGLDMREFDQGELAPPRLCVGPDPLIVIVPSLPRNADVEVQVTGVSNSHISLFVPDEANCILAVPDSVAMLACELGKKPCSDIAEAWKAALDLHRLPNCTSGRVFLPPSGHEAALDIIDAMEQAGVSVSWCQVVCSNRMERPLLLMTSLTPKMVDED
jgi:diphthine-ammonia ligase